MSLQVARVEHIIGVEQYQISPLVHATPRFLARATPLFAVRRTVVLGRSSVSRTLSVSRSVEPSSTITISVASRDCTRALSTASSSVRPRLKQGMTMLIVAAGVMNHPTRFRPPSMSPSVSQTSSTRRSGAVTLQLFDAFSAAISRCAA